MQIRRRQFKALIGRIVQRPKSRTAKLQKLRDVLPICLSIAALCVSTFSFYTTGLRVTDDLRVVVSAYPFIESNFEDKRFRVGAETIRYIFINSGNRSAIISGMRAVFVQPEEDRPLPLDGCKMEKTYAGNFQFEPFIIKPGEMVSRDINFSLATDNGETASLEIPFSSANEKNKIVSFRLCTDVLFTTPSVEFGAGTVSVFDDELDKEVMGTFMTRDKIGEHRPVQIVKRSTIVFLD